MDDQRVAVVLEGIKSDFRVFSEGLSAFREEIRDTKEQFTLGLADLRQELKQELRETKQELTKILNGVMTILDRHDISIEDVEKRVARLERRAG